MLPDKAKYFGPYIAAHSVKEVLDAVYTLFPLRSCKRDFSKNYRQERPCMYYQLGKWQAPCMGYISEEEYGKLVDGVMDLLSGKYQELKRSLESSMFKASEKLDFERAAIFRDKLKALKARRRKTKGRLPQPKRYGYFRCRCWRRVFHRSSVFYPRWKIIQGGKVYTFRFRQCIRCA